MGRSRLRRLIDVLRHTPIHPQWLMPERKLDARLLDCRGVVLDIGAASQWLKSMVSSDSVYVALDYPATAVDLYGSKPQVFGDAKSLPFRDSSIDAVACFEVLEHVDDPARVLLEIERVLRPGGFAYVSMPFLYPVHDAPYDYQRWTVHGWRANVRAAGLLEVRTVKLGHPMHVSAVIASLALVGPLNSAGKASQLLRLPFAIIAIPIINTVAWLLSFLWPDWSAMGLGHAATLKKPDER